MILSFTLDSLIHFLAKVTQYIVGKEYSENSFSTSKTLYCCTLLDTQVSLFSCITKLFKLDQPRSREQIACDHLWCNWMHHNTVNIRSASQDESLAIFCCAVEIASSNGGRIAGDPLLPFAYWHEDQNWRSICGDPDLRLANPESRDQGK